MAKPIRTVENSGAEQEGAASRKLTADEQRALVLAMFFDEGSA